MNEQRRPQSPPVTRILLWGMLLVLYLPLITMITGSFVVPEGFSLQWYREVLADQVLGQALQNSLWVAVLASGVATLIGTLAAIALHRAGKKLRGVLEGLSVLSLVFPEIVFALALLSWFFVLQLQLGLTTVILAHISFCISYVMMTVSARLAHFDDSVEEAARDLGASEWVCLRTIVFPLIRPALIAGFMLSFLLSFDDFLITFFVNGASADTLPVKLYTAMKMGLSPKLNALSSLMFLVSCLMAIFFTRSKGFSLGDSPRAQKS